MNTPKDGFDTVHGKNGNRGTKPVSFASIFMETPPRRRFKLSELSNEESVEGVDVAISLATFNEVSNRFVNTFYGYFIAREGMEQVLENGTWLIRLVPIILNTWTPNTRLKKDEMIVAHVWVKLHNVPIVAYSRVGLSLTTTKLARPIMLDAYTSTMCLKSRGHTTYARAFIKVSSKKALVDSLPPRCDTCKIFDHIDDQCPKKVKVVALTQESDDGFVEVTRKHGKGKKCYAMKGIAVSKWVNVNDEASTSQSKGNKEASSQPKSNVNDNGNLMDYLVDETRKKVEVPPKKTGIDQVGKRILLEERRPRDGSMRMPTTIMVVGFLMVISISCESIYFASLLCRICIEVAM
ncbi:zinc knuckle CX2CX4HX4C containing protein [Tanacetum coccineum]